MAEAADKELNSADILEMATKIVAAHVSNNEVGVSELPGLIEQVYKSLSATAKGTEPVQDKPVPAVSIVEQLTAQETGGADAPTPGVPAATRGGA